MTTRNQSLSASSVFDVEGETNLAVTSVSADGLASAADADSTTNWATDSASRPSRHRDVKTRLETEKWRTFLRVADRLCSLSRQLVGYGDPEERTDLIVEIEAVLDEMVDLDFGQRECLGRCVVAIESVILKAKWTHKHADFMAAVARFIRTRSHIDDSTVEHVYEIIREYGFGLFRGVL